MSARTSPILLAQKEIHELVEKLGADISRDYRDSSLVLVVVLKGALIFASDLIRQIRVQDLKVDFVRVSSYGIGNRESTGTIKLWKDISVNIKGKDVLIIEEIIDSGRTLKFLYNRLLASHPRSLKLCALLDKRCRRGADISPDYCGKVIGNMYVFGYGLDLDERCRNYPDIHYAESNEAV